MMQRITGAIALLTLVACTHIAHLPLAVTVPAASEPSVSVPATPFAAKSPAQACVQRVLSTLTEQQRVGQLFMLGLANDQLGPRETAAIRANDFGSVWFTEKSRLGTPRIRAITGSIQPLAQ